MKKKFIGFILIFTLCSGMLNSLPAMANNDNWSDAYRDFVMEEQYKTNSGLLSDRSNDYVVYDDNPHAFYLYDMDKNGTPELIILYPNPMLWGIRRYVFTYNNGIQFSGTIYNSGLMYSPSGKYEGLFTEWHEGASYYELNQYRLINNKIEFFEVTDNIAAETELQQLEMYTLIEIKSMGWDAFLNKYGYSTPINTHASGMEYSEPSNTEADWKTLYAKKISELENSVSTKVYYSFVDINFDGVPELYRGISNGNYYSGGFYLGSEEIYYIDNGIVKQGEIVEGNNSRVGLMDYMPNQSSLYTKFEGFEETNFWALAMKNTQTNEVEFVTKIGSGLAGESSEFNKLEFDKNTGVLTSTNILKVYKEGLEYSYYIIDGIEYAGYYKNGYVPKSLDGYEPIYKKAAYYSFHSDFWDWEAPYIKDTSIKIVLNNRLISFDQPPVIINGRTLVPLRAIFEALGATVEWDEDTQTVTSTKGNTTVKITIGDNKMYVNKNMVFFDVPLAVPLDVPAQIVNDRTLVPVRAVSEAFDCNVEWDGETRTVKITTKEYEAFISSISGSSTKYNNDLALICAYLSREIENVYGDDDVNKIKNEYKKLGVTEENIYTLSDNHESYYYSLACMENVHINGDNYNILFITARGTGLGRLDEMTADANAESNSNFFEYENRIYDDSYYFYERIQEGIEKEFLKQHPFLKSGRLKVVITGHSLGGSGANLVAAAFDRCLTAPKAWWSDLTTKDDIYCYTFGGIGSVDLDYGEGTNTSSILLLGNIDPERIYDHSILRGYENIHNVYNYYDSFGPHGNHPLTIKNRNSTYYNKFGHVELFGNNDYWANHYNDDGLIETTQHSMATYIDALKDHEKSELKTCLHGSGGGDGGGW